MNVFLSTAQAKGKIKNAVVTTGSFDGVHIGHKVIINRLNQIARKIDGESVLITFHPHPRKVLYPDQNDLKLINSQEEKIELLRKTGLQNLIIIPFTLEFSRTSSHDFVSDILVGQLGAKVVIVGHNHHFGHKRKGDYDYLHKLAEELHFGVEEIPLQDIENETVSSTKIRKALTEGNIQRANAYLDHQYIITGKIRREQQDFPLPIGNTFSIEIREQEKLIPPQGVYASNLYLEDQVLKTVTFILPHQANGPRIVSSLLYDDLNQKTTEGTLYFYKKVMELPVLENSGITPEVIEEAREKVEDLIY
ncbi:MAG: riboflavin biosynthesis protein RibF [Bacteroidales bacterium]|jgi:riboflavin kinase/FMN adenylyltransferase|nr:riboflavin biosynthesis protein RibF [Bacteroidales bacterium]NLM91345.1 riboflavin biosynthesis protein RibF [Bacteroidales bacterium]